VNCFVQELRSCDVADLRWIAERLTKPASDFQKKLIAAQADGSIAIVRDFGEIVGWVRSEAWDGWQTLEAFVAEPYRRRGVAAYATAGLVAAAVLPRDAGLAVFHRSMFLLAKRQGLLPVLFENDGKRWRPV
jgi:hypothetical protein